MRCAAWLALGSALVFADCADESETSDSGGSAGTADASSGAAGSSGNPQDGAAGSTDDASNGGSSGTSTGGYMQLCGGDGGYDCEPGLTCTEYLWTSFEGGISQCGRRLCTRPCGDGCPPPAIGCKDGKCEPPECYPP